MVEQAAKALVKALAPAVGNICWHVSVGGVTLPSFSLALGEKLKRERPLRNPSQPAVFREFEPDIAFYVWCVWRLERDRVVIASSDGAAAEIESGLKRVVGQRLTAIEVTPPAWDLTLQFGDQALLRMFCDHAGKHPSFSENWHARIGGYRIVAGSNAELGIGPEQLQAA